MKKFILYFLLLLSFPESLLAQTDVGTGGAYNTLSEAFTAINEGDLTGVIELRIISSITETVAPVLYQNGYNGTADYTSVNIYPAGSYTIDGDFDGPLIDFNGASNVTLNGRVNQTGVKGLTIINMSALTAASTIQFTESAENNTIEYCIIKGSGTGPTTSGVIYFSQSLTGIGNSNNIIDYNDITSYYDGFTLTRPINAIYSAGSSGYENSGNIIRNNNIYDFLKHGTASNGIFLSSFTTNWTISDNSFYETGPFAPTAIVTYYAIQINNTSGTNFTLSGNFIGGRAALCSGAAWTKTSAFNNPFFAIFMNVGTGTASSVQYNTIKNFTWSNSGTVPWTGIHIAGGAVNIGASTTGNTIGATTGTGSITITGGSSDSPVYGINIAGGGTVNCLYNNIGAITTSNAAAYSSNFTGINKTASAGTTTISNNTIGSISQVNSIIASSASTAAAQSVYGILNAGTGTVTINTNTIANLTNSTTNTTTGTSGRINGISSTAGATAIISNNTIRNLTIANANISTTNSASVCGIVLVGNTAPKTISGNTIYSLSNTNASFAGSVIGLFFIGSTGANIVSGNFIHSLSVASGSAAFIYGIRISSGATTYSNNIISLGGSTLTTVYGIFETGIASNNNSLYFNTVYIGGTVASGTNRTYALYSAVTTNTRNFRNNIFVNARSTTGGSGLHYAAWFNYGVSTNLTLDYNDYYVSGTGGVLGRYNNVDVTSVPLISGKDVSSFAINPSLSNPGGTNAGDYLPSAASLVAATGTGVTTDYAGTTRSSTYPAMGAYEYTVAPASWTWTGSAGTNWSTAANWNYNTVPPSSGNAVIADVTYDPVVNEAPATPAECQNLTINTGAVLTIAAGRALKVNGTLTNIAGNSGLVIKSDALDGDGQLINNTVSVAATVELYLTGGLVSPSVGRFHYFVPPVESINIGTTISSVATELSINNFGGDLLRYREPFAVSSKNQGWQYFDNYPGALPGFSTIVSTTGYNFYHRDNSDVLEFKGALNATQHTFNVSFTPGNAGAGWNLIGNPYPCNYDLNGVAGLGTIVPGISNTVYYNNNGGYTYWNVYTNTGSSGGYTDILPPMTGFFIRLSSGGPSTLTFPVTSKTLNTSDTRGLHKGAADPYSKGSDIRKVKLVLSKGTKADETIALLFDEATDSYNEHYDAFKLFATGSASPNMYIAKSGVDYFMKAVAGPVTDPVTVPMKVVIKEAGSHTITVTEFQNLDGIKTVLKHGPFETILSHGATYTFTSGIGTFTDFELILGDEGITTAVEKPVSGEFKTWYNKEFLYINSPPEISNTTGNVTIYDLQGKPVYDNRQIYFISGQTSQLNVNLPKGLYIVRVSADSKHFTSKVVVF